MSQVELNVDMMDPVTFRVAERVLHDALHKTAPTEAGGGMGGGSGTSSKLSKTGNISKKKRGSDGDSRTKKYRTT